VHYSYYLELYDTPGNGWHSGDTEPVPVPIYYYDNGKVKIRYETGRVLPPVITYPEYFITTIDRMRIVRRGTFCGFGFEDQCVEALPDGKFVFRVTGALSMTDTINTTKWEFCGVEGTSMEELEFTVHNGHCAPGVKGPKYPGDVVNAMEMCFDSPIAVYNGSVTLTPAYTTSLSEKDDLALEVTLREAFDSHVLHGKGRVTVGGAVLNNGKLTVSFSVRINTLDFGIAGYDEQSLEHFGEELEESLKEFVENGDFAFYLKTYQLQNPGYYTLALVTTATGYELELEMHAYEHRHQGPTHYEGAQSLSMVSMIATQYSSYFMGTVALGMLVAGFAAFKLRSALQVKNGEHTPLDEESGRNVPTQMDVSIAPQWGVKQ
jgi:hypothetical protein